MMRLEKFQFSKFRKRRLTVLWPLQPIDTRTSFKSIPCRRLVATCFNQPISGATLLQLKITRSLNPSCGKSSQASRSNSEPSQRFALLRGLCPTAVALPSLTNSKFSSLTAPAPYTHTPLKAKPVQVVPRSPLGPLVSPLGSEDFTPPASSGQCSGWTTWIRSRICSHV